MINLKDLTVESIAITSTASNKCSCGWAVGKGSSLWKKLTKIFVTETGAVKFYRF